MLVFLDNSHRGVIKDIPQTDERRSSILPNKHQVFEGEFNHAIINRILQESSFIRTPYFNVCPELRDIVISK